MGRYYKIIGLFFLGAIAVLFSYLNSAVYAYDPDIALDPVLDISRFAPYILNVSNVENQENITSINSVITGLNGNTTPTACWDYYIDGTCNPVSINKTLIFNSGDNRWESNNIYPDDIYPEIYFATSAITWNNLPLNKTIYRDSYALFKFDNKFDMVGDMSFWIEFNAVARAANSADLEIYLADNSLNIGDFNSDWRNSSKIELVGTKLNNTAFNHTHDPINSSHHLVSLQTNANGTVGVKNLNISNNFWIIIYSKSPNVARGWDLKYHSSSLCNHDNRWYQGTQFSWITTEQDGCPDAHIHIARRSDNMDGIKAVVTRTYSGGATYSSEQNLYFGELPNLPPNATSFLTPQLGTYSGEITVSWDPASDANNNPLLYTIDLLNSDGSVNRNIITSTSGTSTTFDTSLVPDESYSLKGTVCDNGTPNLCTEFYLGSLFSIDNVAPIASLSAISIDSSNSNTGYAKLGDVVTISFTSEIQLTSPLVAIYSGGYNLVDLVSINEVGEWLYEADVTVDENDYDGRITFDISASNLDRQYSDTTDETTVSIDMTAPGIPIASEASGEYSVAIEVALSSEGATIIKYTTDGSTPTCSSGTTYSSAISISEDTILKIVACDLLENSTDVASFSYVINIPEDEDDPVEEDNPDEEDTDDDEEENNGDNTDTEEDTDAEGDNGEEETSNNTVPSVSPKKKAYYTYAITQNEDTDAELDFAEDLEIEDGEEEKSSLNKEKTLEKEASNLYKTKIYYKEGKTYFSEVQIKIVNEKGELIKNAEVKISQTGETALTDGNGIAIFYDIISDNYDILVVYEGKEYTEKNISFETKNAKDGEEIEMEIIEITLPKKSSIWCITVSIIIFSIIGLLIIIRKNAKK